MSQQCGVWMHPCGMSRKGTREERRMNAKANPTQMIPKSTKVSTHISERGTVPIMAHTSKHYVERLREENSSNVPHTLC